MAKVLVTGSSGFVGRYLVNALRKLGHEVFLLDLVKGIESQTATDITDFNEVSNLVSQVKPEIVIHLAAQVDVLTSLIDPKSDLLTNGIGTLNIIEAAFINGCKNFCYIHSGGAIYDSNSNLPLSERSPELPQSPYGLTKNLAEGYVRIFAEKNGAQWSSLALSNCYGPIDEHGRGVIYNFAKALSSGTTPVIYGKDVTRDFIFVSDVVDAICLAVSKPTNMRVNISSNSETSLLELYFEIAREVGDSSINPIINEPKFGEIRRSRLSNLLAQEILGWRPKIELSKGLRLSLSGKYSDNE